MIRQSNQLTYCFNCGKEVPDGAKFCPNCSAPLNPQPRGYDDQDLSPSLPLGITRPRGTGILALIDLVVGILVAALGALASVNEFYAGGVIFAVLGMLSIFVGYGLWKARPWAWLLGLWDGAVYLVLGLLASSPLIIIVGIGNLAFYYFNRTDLRRFLGKSKQ